MTAVIIDDEEMSRRTLGTLLNNYCPEIEILGQASNAKEAYDLIQKERPTLIFLDIEMPHGSGFDLLNLFPSIDFEVIFVTAFDQYAIKAIKFCALDYLLKPIDVEELKTAVKKVSNKTVQPTPSSQYEMLFENLKNDSDPNNRIALPSINGLEFIKVKEIIRCEADGRYTKFYFKKGPPKLVTQNLKEVTSMLESYSFFRIHHSHLICIKKITKYFKGDGGYVVMEDGSTIDVSRRKKEAFLGLFSKKQSPPNNEK